MTTKLAARGTISGSTKAFFSALEAQCKPIEKYAEEALKPVIFWIGIVCRWLFFIGAGVALWIWNGTLDKSGLNIPFAQLTISKLMEAVINTVLPLGCAYWLVRWFFSGIWVEGFGNPECRERFERWAAFGSLCAMGALLWVWCFHPIWLAFFRQR